MANPVKNDGINLKVDVGGAAKIEVKLGGSARVSENQGKGIFQNVNENFTRNPNHAPPVGRGEDRPGNQPIDAEAGEGSTAPPKENQNDEAAPQSRFKRDTNIPNEPEVGEDAELLNRRERGENGKANASETGQANGRGHHKMPPPTQEPPPIILPPHEDGNPNPKTGGNQTNPPILFIPDGQEIPTHGKDRPFLPKLPAGQNQNTPNNQPNMGVNFSVRQNLLAHGNQPIGLIRTVVDQVLRQNDIYLSRPALNRLLGNQTLQNSATFNSQTNLPREVGNLVQNISRQVLSLLDNSSQNHKLIHQISKEIAHRMQDNILEVKQVFLQKNDLGAVHFKYLNVREKMHVAIELLPQHVPPKALESIQNYKAAEVLNAFLLTRGLVSAKEQPADVRNLVLFKSTVLPGEVSITALRDVGQLVKVLISDTAAAKTTVNLDLAVQKFVRILMANNELGVLLATVNLASQSQNQGGLISRSLALAQIYDLINRLIQAGEKALREAAPDASRNLQPKDRNIFLPPVGFAATEETDDAKAQPHKSTAGEAAGALRQFLEFNPGCVFDSSASAFNNPDDARQAQKDFIDLYHDDIAQWLESGKHRYVRDFDFDKPVGVVVERGSDSVFTANTARFVLVRDGSVQGWHFLKSFLVK